MNWLGDMLFNAPQSSARSERARRSGSQPRSGSRSRDEEDAEVSGRIYQMVHSGRDQNDDEDSQVDAATGMPIDNGASDDDEVDDDDDDEEEEEEEEEEGDEEEEEETGSSLAGAMKDDDDDDDDDDDEEEEEEEEDEEENEDDVEDAAGAEGEDGDDEEDDDALVSLTVAELRELLSRKGLPTAGTKAELTERLSTLDPFGSDGDGLQVLSKSLERSMGAAKEASDLFTLNERLHDIIENEAHKDKAVGKVKAELKALRAVHAEDLADLSFEKDVAAVRKRASAGGVAFSEATDEDQNQLLAATAKLNKTTALDSQVATDNDAYRKELADTIAQGDTLAAKITKLSAAIAATTTKTQSMKSQATASEAWSHLYETALAGIDTEHEKHDLQRDSMVEKLRTIIADVTDENSDQVLLMERHSRDIVAEAKAHLAATFEARSQMLKEKYGRLRKLLEAQHEQGDDALTKHQTFLEDHYASKYEEKHVALGAQSDELSSHVAELSEEEASLKTQAAELSAEAAEQDKEAKAKEKQIKKIQTEATSLHGKIGTLRDELYDARASLEDAERKERAVEVDYEILMTENTHLTEEIEKFGDMVKRAERALSASSTASGLAAIAEYQSPKGHPKNSKRGLQHGTGEGNASSSSKAKRSPAAVTSKGKSPGKKPKK